MCMSVEVRITQGSGEAEICATKLSLISEVIQHLLVEHEGIAEHEVAVDGSFILNYHRPLLGDLET